MDPEIEGDALHPSQPTMIEQLAGYEPNPLAGELKEWLEPNDEIRHQTGLELINTRLWLHELSNKYDSPLTIDTVPPQEWKALFEEHDSFWFMGIYKPSDGSREHAKKYAHEYRYALPDIDPDRDVAASPFAVPEYNPNPDIASDWLAWDRMVEMMHANGKKVFIDFVPNHVAIDHPWTREHPEYFLHGNDEQIQQHPGRYHTVTAADGNTYHFAHGKDKYFDAWQDTLQLNYASEDVQREMKEILFSLMDHADGVRCDMALLVNNDIFLENWGDFLTEKERQYLASHDFWQDTVPEAKDRAQKSGKDDFTFIAEAYEQLDKIGPYFDYIYNDRFYKDLIQRIKNNDNPDYLRSHIQYLLNGHTEKHFGDVVYIENHDEERATHMFGPEASKAAAVLAGIIPRTIFLVNQGQEEGRKIRPPMQINRMPEETVDGEMKKFYDRFLKLKHSKLFQQGTWNMAALTENNPNIMAFEVNTPDGNMNAVVCVNAGNSDVSCRVSDIDSTKSAQVYDLTEGSIVENPDKERPGGLYVGLKPWASQVVFYH